jgi:hypothetical protein
MMVDFSAWHPLTAAETGAVPESPGVFEIANLVRTLLFVGTAPESLAASLTQYLEAPGPRQPPFGRLHFRFLLTDEPERVQEDLLLSYRQHHHGALPPAQTNQSPPVRPGRHLKAV